LGKIAKRRSGFNELEKEIEYLKSVYKFFKQPLPAEKELIKKINKTKNELKHNDVGENLWVNADFENEFVIFFVKAVKNYFDSYNEMPNEKSIMQLFEHLTL